MKRNPKEPHYVVCVQNNGCEDLVLRKIYEVIADPSAEKNDYIRVTDESGEDYLYPTNCFLPIDLPRGVERALAHAS